MRYMHSDVAALERMEILRDLRLAKFDVLVGINLLREGLDLPEVSLVAILDADKEGFLRSETSLIQTIGRAARNAGGRVIMYADKITPAMRAAIDETERRRAIQDAYNRAHGIVPKTIIKDVRELIEITQAEGEAQRADGVKMTRVERARDRALGKRDEGRRADDGIRIRCRSARPHHGAARGRNAPFGENESLTKNCHSAKIRIVLESVKKLEELFIAPTARQIQHETAQRACARDS